MKFTEKSLFRKATIVEDTLTDKVSIDVVRLHDMVFFNVDAGVMGSSLFGLSKENVKELAKVLILAVDTLEEIQKLDK